MSLQVYNKTDPPISVIVDNDTYFDSGDMCAGILKVIDKAVYNSPATFIGRDPSLGALYKQHVRIQCNIIYAQFQAGQCIHT